MFVNETLFAGGAEELKLPVIKILQALNKLIVVFTRYYSPTHLLTHSLTHLLTHSSPPGITCLTK